MPFTPKIRKARFVYSGLSADQMQQIGQAVTDSIVARIRSGINCDDMPAKALKPGRNGKKGYPDRKTAVGLAPIRNWISPIRWPMGRIKTLRALKLKTVNENRAVIGFIDPKADSIAHFNNAREKMFGLSPRDREVLMDTVSAFKRGLVSVKKVA